VTAQAALAAHGLPQALQGEAETPAEGKSFHAQLLV
jgi:hypothetical protein